MTDIAWTMDWYRRNCPDGPEHDPRCMAVLCSWERIYNLPIERDDPKPMIPLVRDEWAKAREAEAAVTAEWPGVRRADGGIRKWGDGLMVITRASVSTFDGAALTRMVLAAHQHHCRLDLGPVGLYDLDLDAFEDEFDGHPLQAAQMSAGMQVAITPRVPASVDPHLFACHPGLGDLIGQARARLPRPRAPWASHLMRRG